MIASNVVGKNLDDPGLEPLWATAEELGAFMFIHPLYVVGADLLKPDYPGNLIGNPFDTTICGGLTYLRRRDGSSSCAQDLPLAGGRFTPYQAARWEHGWTVRPEPKQFVSEQPANILGRFYYGTILHSARVLEALIGLAGASRSAAITLMTW
jgi:aminocarboxymuconate-semialdehyde decarboxylase